MDELFECQASTFGFWMGRIKKAVRTPLHGWANELSQGFPLGRRTRRIKPNVSFLTIVPPWLSTVPSWGWSSCSRAGTQVVIARRRTKRQNGAADPNARSREGCNGVVLAPSSITRGRAVGAWTQRAEVHADSRIKTNARNNAGFMDGSLWNDHASE
jgi:hypothetical protein